MPDSRALVIAAHGSHQDPDAARPAFDHGDRIDGRGIFDEVRATFWKEEPSFREILRTLASETVWVVPLFMAEGYFVDRVLPRELGLSSDPSLDVERSVHLTSPVGTHPAMREVIVHRTETVASEAFLDGETALVVVGHGTERHPRSAASTRDHVERLRELDRFAEVVALFLDEAPRVANVTEHVAAETIVVVPLFVADGGHTKRDIPRAIGLDPAAFGDRGIAGELGGRRIRYAPAVGTDPRMADVILERVAETGPAAGVPEGVSAQ